MSNRRGDYSKKEDYMLWVLHDVRHKMAKKKISVSEINKAGAELLKRYQNLGKFWSASG